MDGDEIQRKKTFKIIPYKVKYADSYPRVY